MNNHALSIQDLVKTFDLGFLGAVPFLGPAVTKRFQLKGISQRVEAVRGISLSVDRGEIFGFLGPNGAGKTTTIKVLMGLIHPTSGSGTILGRPLGDAQARARLGFLPEHPYFYEYLKPLEFLDFYARLFNLTYRERKRRGEALLDRLGLTYAKDRPLRKFSKGMIQRIGVAQALINDPDLVVLDEPMSGLDPMGRKDVRDLIFELKEQGKTVFFSSHILADVEALCDRVAIMARGRVRSVGDLEGLLFSADSPVEIVARGIDEEALGRLSSAAERVREASGQQSFILPSGADLNGFLDQLRAVEGAQLVSVIPRRRSLEDLFVEEAVKAERADEAAAQGAQEEGTSA